MNNNIFNGDQRNEPEEPGKSGIFSPEPEVISLFGEPAAKPEINEASSGRSTPDYTPPTAGQTVRMTGLAWSAGISLFGSIIFMLILGWFADLLLGSSPWGKVGGIVIGSVIGFIQFFRINSEIFRSSGSK